MHSAFRQTPTLRVSSLASNFSAHSFSPPALGRFLQHKNQICTRPPLRSSAYQGTTRPPRDRLSSCPSTHTPSSLQDAAIPRTPPIHRIKIPLPRHIPPSHVHGHFSIFLIASLSVFSNSHSMISSLLPSTSSFSPATFQSWTASMTRISIIVRHAVSSLGNSPAERA